MWLKTKISWVDLEGMETRNLMLRDFKPFEIGKHPTYIGVGFGLVTWLSPNGMWYKFQS